MVFRVLDYSYSHVLYDHDPTTPPSPSPHDASMVLAESAWGDSGANMSSISRRLGGMDSMDSTAWDTGARQPKTDYSTLGKVLILLISFCDPVQGLANCLFFVFDIPSIRRRYAALLMMGIHKCCRCFSCSGDDDESLKYQLWLQDENNLEANLPSSETNDIGD